MIFGHESLLTGFPDRANQSRWGIWRIRGARHGCLLPCRWPTGRRPSPSSIPPRGRNAHRETKAHRRSPRVSATMTSPEASSVMSYFFSGILDAPSPLARGPRILAIADQAGLHLAADAALKGALPRARPPARRRCRDRSRSRSSPASPCRSRRPTSPVADQGAHSRRWSGWRRISGFMVAGRSGSGR